MLNNNRYCHHHLTPAAAAIIWLVPVATAPNKTATTVILTMAIYVICLGGLFAPSGAIVVPTQKYSPPGFIRDIETMFEISQELPSNWLPVYLLHRSYPTAWRQDFPVYDFVHQFFVSVVSPNNSSSVIAVELKLKTPTAYSYSAESYDAVQPINRVTTQIIGEPNLWYLFVFKNSGEGTISVTTKKLTSIPLFIEIYGSSKQPQVQIRTTTTTFNPILPIIPPNLVTPFQHISPPFVTNVTKYYPSPPAFAQQPIFTTRSPPFSGPFWPPPALHSQFPIPPWQQSATLPPVFTPRYPFPPPLLTESSQVVIIGPSGQVRLSGPTEPPPPPPGPPTPRDGLLQPPNFPLPPPPPLPPGVVPWSPWLYTRPPGQIYTEPTASKRTFKFNVVYLAVSFAILAFGALTLCITLLTIFYCCKTLIDETQWIPGIPLSDTKSGLLFAFLIIFSLILIVIGVGVVYLHATHGSLEGKWWRPCRLSTAIVCCAVFLLMALAYAIAQFFATKSYVTTAETPEILDPKPKTITVAPATTATRRKEAWAS